MLESDEGVGDVTRRFGFGESDILLVGGDLDGTGLNFPCFSVDLTMDIGSGSVLLFPPSDLRR